jgi:glucose/mannose transport system substrate-binding protein
VTPRLAALSLLLTTGCGTHLLGYSDQEVAGKFDIRTWWSSQSEARAFDKLRSGFTSRYPAVEVLQSTRSPDEQRASLWQDIKEDPPDTFPCLLGVGGVERFVRYDGADVANSPFIALDELAAAHGWREKISPNVVSGLEVDGSLYALPVDVHRINTVLYNVAIFARYGLTPPRTLEDFYAVCEALERSHVVPVAGAADGWTVSALVFDSLLPAVSPGKVLATRDFLRGQSAQPDADAGFLAALGEAVKVLRYVDVIPGDDWSRAVARVGNGEAAMVFMGDWARGELESRDARYDETFGVFPSPGTADVFVFSSDTFPLVKSSKHPQVTSAWLDFIMDPSNQVPFNHIKGGIPALVLTPDQLEADDAYGRKTLTEFNDPKIEKVGALSTLVTAEFEAALNPVMQGFAMDKDTDRVVQFFRANYGLLQPR